MSRLGEVTRPSITGFTVNDLVATKRLGGRSKIYELLNAGVLRAQKIGSRTIITPDSVEEALSAMPAYKPRNSA